jgi:hypothetical protein
VLRLPVLRLATLDPLKLKQSYATRSNQIVNILATVLDEFKHTSQSVSEVPRATLHLFRSLSRQLTVSKMTQVYQNTLCRPLCRAINNVFTINNL